jgi:hypothetical protein
VRITSRPGVQIVGPAGHVDAEFRYVASESNQLTADHPEWFGGQVPVPFLLSHRYEQVTQFLADRPKSASDCT